MRFCAVGECNVKTRYISDAQTAVLGREYCVLRTIHKNLSCFLFPSPIQPYSDATMATPLANPQQSDDIAVNISSLSLSGARDQEQSPLLRLPRELRDIIYGMVFHDCELEMDDATPVPASVGLLKACKQTYIEAIEVYYHSVAIGVGFKRYILLGWLEKLPSTYLNLIPKISFRHSLDCSRLEERPEREFSVCVGSLIDFHRKELQDWELNLDLKVLAFEIQCMQCGHT